MDKEMHIKHSCIGQIFIGSNYCWIC